MAVRCTRENYLSRARRIQTSCPHGAALGMAELDSTSPELPSLGDEPHVRTCSSSGNETGRAKAHGPSEELTKRYCFRNGRPSASNSGVRPVEMLFTKVIRTCRYRRLFAIEMSLDQSVSWFGLLSWFP